MSNHSNKILKSERHSKFRIKKHPSKQKDIDKGLKYDPNLSSFQLTGFNGESLKFGNSLKK